MNQKKRYPEFSGQGLFIPYVLLYNAAKSYIEHPHLTPKIPDNSGEGGLPLGAGTYDPLTAMLYTSFFLEAYINHFRDQLMSSWINAANDNLSFSQKVEQAHKSLGIPFNKNKDKHVFQLIRLRKPDCSWSYDQNHIQSRRINES